MYYNNRILILFIAVLASAVLICQSFAQDPQEIIKAIGEAINAHDVNKILSYFADDVVYEFIPSPQPMTTKEEIKKFFEDLFIVFPDYKTISEHALFSGNIAVTEHEVSQTLLGEWKSMGIPPTGKGGVTKHIDVWEFEGGKIKHVRTYADMAQLLMVVGAMPVPELPEFKPSFTLPDPKPKGLSPIDAVAEANRLWNAHDLVNYAKMHRSDAKFLIATLGVPMDRNAFIASQEMYMGAFPDVQCEVVNTFDMGDGWVAEEHIYKGKHTGPYMGIPPTGRQASMRACVLRHSDEEGLVTDLSIYWDGLTLLTQLGVFPPTPTPEEVSRALIHRCYDELWNQQKLEVIDEIRAPDVVYHDVAAGDIIGTEAGKLHVAQSLSAFHDFKAVAEDIVAEGDMAAVRYTFTATHKGEAFGVPATGASITLTGINIIKVANGKIVEEWAMWDVLGALEQIGAFPKMRQNYAWGAPSSITGDPGDPEKNKAFIIEVMERIWNKKEDLSILDEFNNPNTVLHIPVEPISPWTGVETSKKVVKAYLTAFPDMHVTINDIFAEGDKVAVRWTNECTHKGEIMGIPPTGKRVKFSGITIYRLANGKVVEEWWSWDVFGLIQQLTAQAPDKEAIRELAKRGFEEIWNKKSLNAIDELHPPSYIGHHPGGVGDIKGTTVFKQFVSAYIASFPDIHFELHDIVVEDNLAAMRWTSFGTHLGPFMGVPPTGKVGPGMTGMVIAKFEGDKQIESWNEYDLLGLMGWLGLIPGREIQQWGDPSPVTGAPGDPEKNKAIVMRFAEEVFNQKKLNVVDEIFHPKAISHDPVVSSMEDITLMKQAIAAYITAFPDLHAKKTMLIAEGDKVIGHWIVTGTHQGEFFGIPPTGKKAVWSCINMLRFADGKIAEVWWSYDALGIMQQLGIIPAGPPKDYTNVFFMSLSPGLNMISLPLEPIKPYTARSLAQEMGATVVIKYDTTSRRFVGFVPSAPNDGFAIKGGEGYIVNVLEGKTVVFTGAAWTNQPPVSSAPPALNDSAWAFVFSGSVLDGEDTKLDGDRYTVVLRNLRTGETLEGDVKSTGYFAIADADLNRKPIIQVGDRFEIKVVDSTGKIVSGPFIHQIISDDIRKAMTSLQLRLGEIIPKRSALFQNYPNPFNPETWIPFQLSEAGDVVIKIFDSSGRLLRTLDLGYKPAGMYVSKSKAGYWDGRNESGELVASGVYFYSITSGRFSEIRKMIVAK